MKKSTWIVVIVVILVLVLGYLGRHKIKTMIAGSSTTPAVTQTTQAPMETPMASSSAATAQLNNALVTTKTDPTKGAYLADAKGMTLYIYDKDTAGVSNCTAGCAKAWPPYTTTSTTLPADFTTVKRSDGTMQVAFMGKPLYYYATDSKAGEILGDGVGGVWHLVKP